MFLYPKSYAESKNELYKTIQELRDNNYHVDIKKEFITETHYIDKIIISARSRMKNRIVLSSGIHGIEGYIGHVCQIYFLKHILQLLDKHTEVILYHIINPFGMIHNRRFNQNNVDLNRNYSNTSFTLKNPDFIKVQSFLVPRVSRSRLSYNLWFYYTVFSNIIKHGVRSMNNAVLKGQKIDPQSIYYSGQEYEPSTKYILSELHHIYQYTDQVVWIDIHSGYGKKYSMSVINSRYETKKTTELKRDLKYRDIIGFEQDAMYDTDGDITEKLYFVHQDQNYSSDLLALCFEFGTLGHTLLHELRSFKSILLENNVFHLPHNEKMIAYSGMLQKRLFMPNDPVWKKKQIDHFKTALTEILAYKKLI